MALYDRWTRAQFRAAVRRELMDTGGQWWTDTELNSYLDHWQDQVQDALEFSWGTATTVVGSATSTVTFTDIATDILRPGFVFWDNKQLSPLTVEELNIVKREWRAGTAARPGAFYVQNLQEFVLWPIPSSSGTLRVEYPLSMTFAADTSTSELPPWTRYSAIDYCAFRAYLRAGPNQDLDKAAVYKGQFNLKMLEYEDWKRQYMPYRYGQLRPPTAFEVRLVDPDRGGLNVPVPTAASSSLYDEVPSGTVNGTNDTFTLTHSPNPTASLKLFVDGVLMTQGTHYTLSGSTITFAASYIPQSGQTLFASYRYSA